MSGSRRDPSWEMANRDCLVAELGVLRARVRGDDSLAEAERRLDDARKGLAQRSALDEVSEGFGLSGFERAVLLLAAGPELVAATAEELVTTGGGPRPSFGLGLSVIPDAHWSAITPTGPLRRWNLVRLTDPVSPTHSPLLADQRVLHHLTGAGYLDPELAVPHPAGDRSALAARHPGRDQRGTGRGLAAEPTGGPARPTAGQPRGGGGRHSHGRGTEPVGTVRRGPADAAGETASGCCG